MTQIGILVRESTSYTYPGQTFDYECVLAETDETSVSFLDTPDLGVAPGKGGVKYTLVFGNEYGTRKHFSHMPRPGEETHVDISRTLVNRITAESMERLHRTNPKFAHTVLTLLSLVQPYSLC